MTTALLPFTPTRAPQSLMMRRWLLGGRGGCWQFLETRELREIWAEHEPVVVAWHVRHWPGSRPMRWWQYSAPEPRRRLGGVGDELSSVTAYMPSWHYGIPSQWRVRGDYFSRGTAIDPSNPPAYEAEASFLLRHRLLLPGERERLRARDFKRELVLC